MRRNPALIFAGLALGTIALAGCTADPETAASDPATTEVTEASTTTGYSELSYDDLGVDEPTVIDESRAVDVTLADGASTAVAGVSVDGDVVTIAAAGTYRLSGTLTAGQVVVDVDGGQVNLILDGVDITSADTAAINVVQADAVVVSLAAGSTNSLSDAATKATAVDNSATASDDTDAPNATLYSTADLTITGGGSLAVKATVNDGITSKDSLIIAGGSISVDAVDDGARGKDHIVVRDGTLTIKAGGDGIKADNDEVLTDPNSTKGVAWFEGGKVAITAGDDGISAERQVTFAGGAVTVNATDDGVHTEGVLSVSDGTVDVESSNEGLEGAVILVSGGDSSVVASDDGINAAGGYLEAATVTTGTADAGGADAGGGQMPGGGHMPTDGQVPDRGARQGDGGGQMPGGGMGGDTTVTDPSELTVTAASGSEGGAMPGESNDGSGRYVLVSGGTLTVDAQGDGLDSNGTLSITGGVVTVAGPSSNGNAPVDADSYAVSGGELLAYGSSGMLVTPDADASQGTVVAVFSGGVAAGSEVTITSADGEELASFTTLRTTQSVTYSSTSVATGEGYTITVAGVEVGTVTAS